MTSAPHAPSPAPVVPAALDGIRAIEIGTFISAPFAATLLADFGAEVIKLELPDIGDPMRTLGEYPPGGDSSYWWSAMGRNKRSVALDVRTDEGREILGRLLESADVLVENFRPGTLERWGITMDWVRARRPGIIVARISGYGQDGPWRDVPGFDRNAQAFSGLVYVTGEPDMPPQQAGLPLCDFNAGLWGAFGIVTALLGQLRQRRESGNEIDLALYETMIPFLKDMPQRFRHQGRVTERTGNTPDYVAPGGAYRTGSGEWIFISGTGDRVFERLITAVGRPDLAAAEQFRQNKGRVTHRPVLDAAINEWLAARSTDEAIAQLQAADVPAVKIQSIRDVMTHPQVIARGNFIDVPQPEGGQVCMPAPLPRMADMPPQVRWPGEHLGQSTRRVLRDELGLDDAELARLAREGVIGA
ncbi:CoA transferase [Ramlibacter sp. AW1]|uniref:CoA transferase n=1 Tax=Ramlibacter aurantiacus TaxID=2801330 RepID=A0A937D5Z4_9BURK|nr:CoA transferase [Ramlibacter aurantiacus]MBL0419271.1 CoA transferase [Ramlibacter aurantiacus]